MTTLTRKTAFVGAALACVAVIGCGSGVYPVKGRITYEGKPMKGGGSISFVPTGNQAGKTAAGEIADDGSYELMTHRAGDGSMPGDFRVVIVQVTQREPKPGADGERMGQPITVVGPADTIPLIYSDTQNSPLTAKVEAKSLNELHFDLKRDAGGAVRPKGARGEGLSRWLALLE